MIDLIQGVLACLQGRVLEGRMCGGDGSGGDELGVQRAQHMTVHSRYRAYHQSWQCNKQTHPRFYSITIQESRFDSSRTVVLIRRLADYVTIPSPPVHIEKQKGALMASLGGGQRGVSATRAPRIGVISISDQKDLFNAVQVETERQAKYKHSRTHHLN